MEFVPALILAIGGRIVVALYLRQMKGFFVVLLLCGSCLAQKLRIDTAYVVPYYSHTDILMADGTKILLKANQPPQFSGIITALAEPYVLRGWPMPTVSFSYVLQGKTTPDGMHGIRIFNIPYVDGIGKVSYKPKVPLVDQDQIITGMAF